MAQNGGLQLSGSFGQFGVQNFGAQSQSLFNQLGNQFSSRPMAAQSQFGNQIASVPAQSPFGNQYNQGQYGTYAGQFGTDGFGGYGRGYGNGFGGGFGGGGYGGGGYGGYRNGGRQETQPNLMERFVFEGMKWANQNSVGGGKGYGTTLMSSFSDAYSPEPVDTHLFQTGPTLTPYTAGTINLPVALTQTQEAPKDGEKQVNQAPFGVNPWVQYQKAPFTNGYAPFPTTNNFYQPSTPFNPNSWLPQPYANAPGQYYGGR